MKSRNVFTAAVVLTVGVVPAAYGLESQSSQEQFTQQTRSDTRSVSEHQSTKGRSNSAPDQMADQHAQVTIGGAKSLVSGEIRNVEGEYYFIKEDETGDEVRLLVNKDANLDCSAAPITTAETTFQNVARDRQPAEQQGPEASDSQKVQGQKKNETAVGSGFTIGTCSFMPGDRIKAEVDDMGRVTTLKFAITREGPQTARSFGESAGTGELAIPGNQEKPGQLDMTGSQGYPPKEYAMPPVPLGELKNASANSFIHSSVKNAEGNVIGSVDSLLMDSQTGRIEYAVVLLDDSKQLEVVPWAHLKIGINQGKQEFILNTTQYQLSPAADASKDLSPQVEKLVEEDRRASLQAESQKPETAKIEIIMQDQGYQVKGHSVPDSLTAIVLRNQDTETHGFSSPLFKDLDIRAEGDAIEVETKGIRSYHVPAGRTATLYFTPASLLDPSTGIRETTQYPIQCDLHPSMKGELLVVETRGEVSGG
jgi:hypothetical protein